MVFGLSIDFSHLPFSTFFGIYANHFKGKLRVRKNNSKCYLLYLERLSLSARSGEVCVQFFIANYFEKDKICSLAGKLS